MNVELNVLLKNGTTENLIDFLPHGSGIDYDWVVDEDDDHYLVSNGYHAMDENGFYCGRLDFTIHISKNWDNVEWHKCYDFTYSDADLDTESVEPEEIQEYLDDTFAYYFGQIMNIGVINDNA